VPLVEACTQTSISFQKDFLQEGQKYLQRRSSELIVPGHRCLRGGSTVIELF